MQFEWYPNKAKANLDKHGISFEVALEIFSTEKVISFEDRRFDYGETREIALGEVEGVVLTVVFTVRDNESD